MPTFVPPAPVTEDVAKGLLLALAAIPVGAVVTVLLWKAGYVASISAFVLAALAVWLYRKGAGAVGRAGFVVVAGVVVVGLLASMTAIVVTDAMDFYSGHASRDRRLGVDVRHEQPASTASCGAPTARTSGCSPSSGCSAPPAR